MPDAFFPPLSFSIAGFGQVFLVTGLNRKFGISDEWFAVGDSLILTVLGQVIHVCFTFLLLCTFGENTSFVGFFL